MRHAISVLALVLLPLSAQAQGLGDLFRDFQDRLAPELRDLSEGLAPLLEDLRGLIDEFGAYEAPVRLPNGDILIRRKPGAPPPPDLPPEDDGSIAL